MKEQSILPRLAWHARELRRGIGLSGVVGICILIVSLLAYIGSVAPVASNAAELRREIAVSEAAQGQPGGISRSSSDPVQQLNKFYRFFPKPSQASDDLAKLHGVALIHNVQLEQGTYRLVKDKVGKLSLYEITLPVKGEYTQLRKFMSQALTEIPHLALDSVSFQRQNAADAALESQIKFTLFLGEAS